MLSVENDFDSKGLASIDEFSDAISACVSEPFNGTLAVHSITLTE